MELGRGAEETRELIEEHEQRERSIFGLSFRAFYKEEEELTREGRVRE